VYRLVFWKGGYEEVLIVYIRAQIFNMVNIANEVVSVPLAGGSVRGLMFGNEMIWSFESEEEAFMELFPAGAAYSFSDYGMGEVFAENRKFQADVAARIKELLETRRMMDVS
jgi:hypothetical protein